MISGPAARPPSLTPRQHLWLTHAVVLLASVAVIAVLLVMHGTLRPRWGAAAAGAALVTLAPFAFTAVAWARRRAMALPARCPECAGRAHRRGARDIEFACSDCGHVHATGWVTLDSE